MLYRLRAGHLPKRHAQNTDGMEEDGRLCPTAMRGTPRVWKRMAGYLLRADSLGPPGAHGATGYRLRAGHLPPRGAQGMAGYRLRASRLPPRGVQGMPGYRLRASHLPPRGAQGMAGYRLRASHMLPRAAQRTAGCRLIAWNPHAIWNTLVLQLRNSHAISAESRPSSPQEGARDGRISAESRPPAPQGGSRDGRISAQSRPPAPGTSYGNVWRKSPRIILNPVGSTSVLPALRYGV